MLAGSATPVDGSRLTCDHPAISPPRYPPPQAFDLAENFNAPELSKRCALYCLQHYGDMLKAPKASTATYAAVMQRMAGRLRQCLTEEITRRAGGVEDMAS